MNYLSLNKTIIDTFCGNFDVLTVRNWLGHTDIKTTQNYINYTEMYYNQAPVDWIATAIKPQKGGDKKIR